MGYISMQVSARWEAFDLNDIHYSVITDGETPYTNVRLEYFKGEYSGDFVIPTSIDFYDDMDHCMYHYNVTELTNDYPSLDINVNNISWGSSSQGPYPEWNSEAPDNSTSTFWPSRP